VIWTERPGEFDITSPPSYAEGLDVDAGRTGWVETADRSPSRGAILGMVIRPDHAPVGGAFRARLSARCWWTEAIPGHAGPGNAAPDEPAGGEAARVSNAAGPSSTSWTRPSGFEEERYGREIISTDAYW